MDYCRRRWRAIVAVVWGARNKLDALFNDRNHTYSVEMLEWTRPSVDRHLGRLRRVRSTGTSSIPTVSTSHTATVDAIPDHQHVMTEEQVGSDEPFDITPEYLTVYSYVRSCDARTAGRPGLRTEHADAHRWHGAARAGARRGRPVLTVVSAARTLLSAFDHSRERLELGHHADGHKLWERTPSRCDLLFYQGDDVVIPLYFNDPALAVTT